MYDKINHKYGTVQLSFKVTCAGQGLVCHMRVAHELHTSIVAVWVTTHMIKLIHLFAIIKAVAARRRWLRKLMLASQDLVGCCMPISSLCLKLSRSPKYKERPIRLKIKKLKSESIFQYYKK